jgi:hypothetical protein
MSFFVDEQLMLHRVRQLNLAETWAQDLYHQTQRQSWWQRLLDLRKNGENGRLLSLRQFLKGHWLKSQRDGGLRQVSLGQIRGSEDTNRCVDFDNSFRLRNPALVSRWLSIAQAWYNGIELPPVKLIKVEHHYFIRDGHHRISVAQAAGQDTIWAHVLIKQQAFPKKCYRLKLNRKGDIST